MQIQLGVLSQVPWSGKGSVGEAWPSTRSTPEEPPSGLSRWAATCPAVVSRLQSCSLRLEDVCGRHGHSLSSAHPTPLSCLGSSTHCLVFIRLFLSRLWLQGCGVKGAVARPGRPVSLQSQPSAQQQHGVLCPGSVSTGCLLFSTSRILAAIVSACSTCPQLFSTRPMRADKWKF